MTLNKDNLRLPQAKLGADIQVQKSFKKQKIIQGKGFDILTR